MDLASLQQDVLKALFTPQSTETSQIAHHYLSPHQSLSTEQCLNIYRNSVHGILKQHLSSVYRVSQQLVGEQRFRLLCDEFIDQHPPTTPHLPDYGAGLPGFLQSHHALKNLRWVVDVSELEWRRNTAWHAANQATSDFSTLARLSSDAQAALIFEPPDSAQLLRLNTVADEIWAIHQTSDLESISNQLQTVDIDQEIFIIIYRQGPQLHQIRLDEQTWHFVNACRAGITLEALGARFGETLPQHLTIAIEKGWICAFS